MSFALKYHVTLPWRIDLLRQNATQRNAMQRNATQCNAMQQDKTRQDNQCVGTGFVYMADDYYCNYCFYYSSKN
jgi:hypothetical protein